MKKRGLDALVVYGDREHFAQVKFGSRMAPGAIVQARVTGRGAGHLEVRLVA
jgi:hypothetical protein